MTILRTKQNMRRGKISTKESSLMWTIIISNIANLVKMISVMMGERCMNVMEYVIDDKIRGCMTQRKHYIFYGH